MTIQHAIERGFRLLQGKELRSPRLDAELLLAFVLSASREYLIAHAQDTLGSDQEARYRELLRRRSRGVPIQYIRGIQEFFGRDYLVNPTVLIPRPETELLAELCLQRLQSISPPAKVLELGTGSGCLAVTFACEIPALKITATDISVPSLQLARLNAKRHQAESRIQFVAADWLSGLRATPRFDVIASNPPYVGWSHRAHVDRSVFRHEPRRAVFAGERGLGAYRKILQSAQPLLRNPGCLILELGQETGPAVISMASQHGWLVESTHKDLAGILRCLILTPRLR